MPGLAPEDNSPAEHLALHLANANGTHAVSYCAEAGLFQQIGIPAIICGPGSIEQAHKPDEYIDMSEMRKVRPLWSDCWSIAVVTHFFHMPIKRPDEKVITTPAALRKTIGA